MCFQGVESDTPIEIKIIVLLELEEHYSRSYYIIKISEILKYELLYY